MFSEVLLVFANIDMENGYKFLLLACEFSKYFAWDRKEMKETDN